MAWRPLIYRRSVCPPIMLAPRSFAVVEDRQAPRRPSEIRSVPGVMAGDASVLLRLYESALAPCRGDHRTSCASSLLEGTSREALEVEVLVTSRLLRPHPPLPSPWAKSTRWQLGSPTALGSTILQGRAGVTGLGDAGPLGTGAGVLPLASQGALPTSVSQQGQGFRGGVLRAVGNVLCRERRATRRGFWKPTSRWWLMPRPCSRSGEAGRLC